MKKTALLTIVSIGCLCNANAQAPNYVAPTGLVSWYPFNNNADDATPSGNHGTVHGATLVSDRFGNANAAYEFLDDTIVIDNTQNFDLDPFSVSGWILTGAPADGSYRGVFSHFSGTDNGPWTGYFLGTHSEAGELFMGDGSSSGLGLHGSTAVNDNVWHLLTATYDGDICKLYLDGVQDLTANYEMTQDPAVAYIGNSHLNEAFDGTIDDIGVWGRALTPCEIQRLYDTLAVNLPGVTVSADSVLTADAAGLDYQWVNCSDGFSEIPGATSQSYTAMSTGSYAVLVDNDGCTTMSECYSVDFVGIDDLENSYLSISPNPTNDVVTIRMKQHHTGYVELMDLLGEEITRIDFDGTETILDLSPYAQGTYLVNVRNANGSLVTVQKVIYR